MLAYVLPAAAGVALNPLAIIALVLMLLSSRSGRTAPVFVVRYVLGLSALTAAVVVTASLSDDGSDSTGTSGYWIKLVIGLTLLALVVPRWRDRPAKGATPELPGWMAGVGATTSPRAFGLGAVLSGANPKNLVLATSGLLSVEPGGYGTAGTVWSAVLFVVIGSSVVIALTTAHRVTEDAMTRPLVRIRTAMETHYSTIVIAILLVLGLINIVQGAVGLLRFG